MTQQPADDIDVNNAAPDRRHNGMAGLKHAQLSVNHQTSGRGNFTSERALREGIKRNSSGTCGTICRAGQLKDSPHILNQRSIQVDSNTYVSLLQECINRKDLAGGKKVHGHIIESEFKPNICLVNTLVNMYAKCGSVGDARQVFDNMPERDLSTWNIMIAGYARHDCGKEAFMIYEEMQQEGVVPDIVTFICILNACGSLGIPEKGKEVHVDIIKAGIVPDLTLETALADMYAKCGSMNDAQQVFDNMPQRNEVTWNVMIAGYTKNGCSQEVFEIYKQMQQDRVLPNTFMFTSIITACASLRALEKGKEVHAAIIKAGIVPDIILGTALADMYAKCRSMMDARKVFDNMAQRNVVSWNAMIGGYAQNGLGREAFDLYEQMQQDGVTPNRVTYICVLNACTSLGVLEKGNEVHANIIKARIASHINLDNTLVDMYAKCGSMKDARQVFDSMLKRDLVSWNAIIAGYAQHGCGREALQLYEQMQNESLKPNSITFTSVLSACSHMGLMDEGLHYFNSMYRDHGLTPVVAHFGCMVDLLGRGGQLDEAEDFINKMPIEPDGGVWGALLGACRLHDNVHLAERAAKCLFNWNSQDPAAYVILSNVCGAAGRWDVESKVRRMEE